MTACALSGARYAMVAADMGEFAELQQRPDRAKIPGDPGRRRETQAIGKALAAFEPFRPASFFVGPDPPGAVFAG